MATRQRRGTTAAAAARKSSARSAAKPASTSTDELADKLASTLRITSTTKAKPKATTNDVPTEKVVDSKEQKRISMRAINSASQTLSAVAQSGWKRSSASLASAKDKQAQDAKLATSEASKHTKILRQICQDDIDVERAAMSILGKLVTLEMYDEARTALEPINTALCSIHKVSQESMGILSLLSIPTPTTIPQDTTLLTLTSTYFAYAFSTVTHHIFNSTKSKQVPDIGALADALSPSCPHTLLAWVPIFSQTLEAKQIDPILSRAYTALTKSCAAVIATTTTTPASSPPCVDHKAIFLLRMYAVHCLLHTSPGIIEPSTFWDQVVKFAAVYAKAKPPAPEEVVLKVVLGAFDQLHKSVEVGRGTAIDRFASGRGWLEFCEYWMGFAKKAGDIRLVDRIASLLQSTPSSSSASSSPQANGSTTTNDGTAALKPGESGSKPPSAVDTARLVALFTQTTTVLEQNSDDVAQRLQEVAGQLRTSRHIPQHLRVYFHTDQKDEDVAKAGHKIDRALERLRRATVTFLESTKAGDQRRSISQALLNIISDIYKPICLESPSSDILTRVVDTYFVLAKTSLVVSDAHTYVTAHDYLSSAAAIINGLPLEKHALLNVPNYLRCISGAFHNLGGSLYQGERYGAAVGFLKDACALGSKALEMRNGGSAPTLSPQDEKGKEKEDKTEEGWKQLEEQLYRRWELLGVCHSKISERQEAYQAFMQSICWFPYVQSGLDSLANTVGAGALSTFWESGSNTKQLGALVDRVTYLGACELFLPAAAVSLAGGDNAQKLSPAVVGVLLERQIDHLESSRHKECAANATEHLLVDTLRIYRSDKMPLRRARVLTRCLELMYHVGGVELLERQVSVDAIANDVFNLLRAEDLAEDRHIASLRAQYEATTHLWLALHAHRQSPIDNAQIQRIATHAESACTVLKTITNPKQNSPRKSSTPRKTIPKQISAHKTSPLVSAPSTRQRASTRSSAKKTAVIGSGTRARTRTAPATAGVVPKASVVDSAPPVTPARKSRKALQPLAMNTQTPPKTNLSSNGLQETAADLVEIEKLVSLLQLVAQISGLLALTLTKTRVLDVTRRLCEKKDGTQSDAYITASADLARELIILGKTKRAVTIFNQASNSVRSGSISTEARILFLLRFGECLAKQGILDGSAVYLEALELSDDWDPEARGSTIQRVHARVKTLEYAATASQVFACIQACQDNISGSISAMLQSLRLWTRATETLSRLSTPLPSGLKQDDENPFEASKPSTPMSGPSQPTADQVLLSSAQASVKYRPATDAIEWRVSEGLLSTLFSLSEAYLTRGSAREADYFAQRARELSDSLRAPPMVARALTKMAEIQLHRGDTEAGLQSLEQAGVILEGSKGIDLVEVRRLQGLYHERSDKNANAYEIYEAVTKMIEELDEMFTSSDGAAGAFRRSSIGVAKSSKEVVLPRLLSDVLRHQAWLLRDDADLHSGLLEKFQQVAQSIGAEAEQHSLLARLALSDVYKRFHDDMFLSSLAESAIAVPMGMSRAGEGLINLPVQDLLSILKTAEEFYWTNLTLTFAQGVVTDVRESLLSLALVQAFQTSLGRIDQNGSILAASLLDTSTAITLRREMLETIDLKFPVSPDNDTQWPRIDADGRPQTQAARKMPHKSKFLRTLPPPGEDNLFEDNSSIKEFWNGVKRRYQALLSDPASQSSPRTIDLPTNWTVVHIGVTEDKGSLFLARQPGGKQHNPLVFRVPLNRRRSEADVDEAESLTLDDVVEELREIVKLSDEGTKRAKHVKRDDPTARAAWWKERMTLDSRLRSLLENIEFCWLGAFKTVLSSRRNVTPAIIAHLSNDLERIFRRALHSPEKRPRSRSAGHKKQASRIQAQGLEQVTFDDTLLECLATLSPKCKDEELEDLAYFILDLYQFHGVPVAIAEIDITQLVVDLRLVLEDNNQRMAKQKAEGKDDEHLFLVLDRKLQGLPWESMPILKGRSVSRIPSLDFLLDRMELVKWKQAAGSGPEPKHPGAATIDPRKGYFILNPSGDLRGTAERFKDWSDEMKKAGWDGISGQPPSEQQFLNALRDKDIVVYFGHGGGEQYIRSHKIRTLPTCAVTMLWGCSSGMLSEMGDFDRIGTPYHYMLAGCPTLVANLWDVTDRDIDKFSQAVFDKIQLTGQSIVAGRSGEPASIVEAVAQSRDVCKLKYLTGAAPVVYGIPFYL